MFPEMTSAVATEYMGYAHRELCFDMPIYTLDEDITLDGTNYLFSLNADDIRVWSATYWRTNTTSKPLRALTRRGMELKMSGWRNTPEQEPGVYAVYPDSGTLKVHLYPSPSTVTSGGYPKVTLRVSRYSALGTNLPDSVLVPDVYVLKAAYKYCLDHGLYDRAKLIEAPMHEAVQKCLQGFDFMVVDAPPETMMGFRFPGVVR